MPDSGPILIVEDSDEDFEVITWALAKAGITRALLRATRGEEVVALLDPAAAGARPAIRPSLLLLDLNLPGMGGREVLRWLRETEATRLVPVVVLSTSNNPRDIEASYRYGASGYVCKPMQLQSFADKLNGIVSYWFDTVMHPLERR